jgi:hypothetical protein
MNEKWSVEIKTNGPSGYATYIEGQNRISFDWEFGGAPKTVTTIWGPRPNKWDELVPWAKGRRIEIMHRIAEEAIKQKARHCVAEYVYDETVININSA